jgi:alpha/beta superfamily hydrolase
MIHEHDFFLAPRSLYVSHYRTAAANGRCVVVLPPLFEELARTRKVLVSVARALAQKDLHLVRFDYRGTGLSGGSFTDFSPAEAEADVDAVLAYCASQGLTKIELLGFRFGGYLALRRLLKADAPQIRALVWEPIVDLGAYFGEMLRQEMTNQVVGGGESRPDRDALVRKLESDGELLVDGYRVSRDTYRGFAGAPAVAFADLQPAASRVKLLWWDRKKAVSECEAAGVPAALVDGIKFSWKHIRYLEPRPEPLMAATTAFFEQS